MSTLPARGVGKHGIQGFPTLKLFLQGKDGQRRAMDYAGARKAAAVIEWALDQVKRNALSRIGASAGRAPRRSGTLPPRFI